jgi:hypothetical protein
MMKEYFKRILQAKSDFERSQGSRFSREKYNLLCFVSSCYFIVAWIFVVRRSKLSPSDDLFLSWGRYSSLFDKIPVNGKLIEFVLGKRSYLNLVSYTTPQNLFCSFRYVLSPYQQFYYLEYSALCNMIALHNTKAVYTYSLLDRYMFYLDFYCNENDIKFHIIQHGAISGFEIQLTHTCDTFYILYSLNRSLLNKVVLAKNYIDLDLDRVLVHDALALDKIAFATSPRYTRENTLIVMECLKLFGELIVYPHPRDKIDYNGFAGVTVSKSVRHGNLRLLISHTSTLVLTYVKETSIEILTLELRGLQSDIVSSEQVAVYNEIDELLIAIQSYA